MIKMKMLMIIHDSWKKPEKILLYFYSNNNDNNNEQQIRMIFEGSWHWRLE